VDVVVDASGVTETLKTALNLVRPGGQITKIGWGPEVPSFGLDALVAKAVRLHGSFSHHWETWERVLALMGTAQLQPQAIAEDYRFGDWQRGFEAMADHQIGKAVLTL
jgi:alcohol dehydrogenase/L-iditol 2-dehydrogenase